MYIHSSFFVSLIQFGVKHSPDTRFVCYTIETAGRCLFFFYCFREVVRKSNDPATTIAAMIPTDAAISIENPDVDIQ